MAVSVCLSLVMVLLVTPAVGPQSASAGQQFLRNPSDPTASVHPPELIDISGEPPTLKCVTGEKSLNIRGDTRAAYEQVARQFDIEVAFDADLRDMPVRLQVNNIDCSTALELVGVTTGTFWSPLTDRLFFVAQDTPEKRKDYDISLVRTFVMRASETRDEMTEIVRTVREITGVTQASLDTASHSLTVRTSPRAMPVVAALISDLEQPLGELIVEIEVLEIDRDVARDFGVTPPENSEIFSLSSQEVQQAEQSYEQLVDVIDEVFGSTSIPPVIAFGGGSSTFLAELPNAAANFSEALSLVRQGRKVILRAQDGKPSNLFVGDRIPVALSSYSSSLTSQSSSSTSIPPITDYKAGTGPSFVATGISRDDGINDLFVANSQDNTVSVLLGNGDGTFQNQTTYATGGNPVSIATGEFDANNNDNLDLAVANKDSDTLSILLGNGDGTFQKQTVLHTGHTPVSVIAANFHDLASQPEVDLAVSNQADNTISIFQGNGDGTFKTPISVSLPAGYQPAGLAAADLNGDGHIDLVVADSGNNTFSVLLGNGDGTFEQRTDYPTGDEPVYAALGDFNGDGAPDIALADEGSNSVTIYYNQENNSSVPLGKFVPGSTRDFSAGTGPTSIAIADYNLDGSADLAVSDATDNAVTVLLNAGGGLFAALSEVPVADGPVSITTADFNDDGRPDVATADSSAGEATVILNSTSLFGAGSQSSNSLFPSVQYMDVGLKVKVTPRIDTDQTVTLGLDFEMSTLTGQSINSIPVIHNESLNQTVRIGQNQTAAIGGFLQQQLSNVVTGTPGISSIPGLGSIDRDRNAEDQNNELLILVTPRMIRRPTRQNHRIYAGRGSLDNSPATEAASAETPAAQPSVAQPPLSPAQPPTPSPQPEAQNPLSLGPQDQSSAQPSNQDQSPAEPPH
jgi:Bacterial type II and III secretion system protein/FG-GAP-like repeat